MVQAIHTAVAGRVRFKVEGLYRSEALKRFLEGQLARLQDITHVSANALTGNLLVCYNSGNTPETIASLISGLVAGYHNHQPAAAAVPVAPEPSPPDLPVDTGVAASAVAKLKTFFSSVEDQPDEVWHVQETETVLAALKTSRTTGLSVQAVAENLEKYGPNMLPEAEPRSGWEIFIDQFKSLPVALLGAAAGISVLTGGILDAALILGVVTANAFIGYKTESEAEKTIRSLQTLVRPTALVIRDGQMSEISAEDIVLGDLLVLRPGSYVAADCRLVEATHLSVDESALTGESLPVVKTTEALAHLNIPLGDRLNMAFMGTLVTGGEGLAVVVATGSFTEIGKIQTMMGEATTPETPMQRQLGQVGDQLVLICSGVCGVVFLVGFFRGLGWLAMLRTSICLAAAAVPEGLPTVATTTLSLGIRDMRRHKVLIRHLDAVETLGALQTICLDKTGTITRNEMVVVEIFAGMRTLQIEGKRFATPSGYVSPSACIELQRLLMMSVLCNETEIYRENKEYKLLGTPTETALVHLALNADIDVVALRQQYPVQRINYRTEHRQFMGTLHDEPAGGTLVAIKGSPLEVLSMCSEHLRDNQLLPLTDEDRQAIEAENERMAGLAQRVLGVAYSDRDDLINGEMPSELVWLGIVGMADPIREGVGEAIAAFHAAGIETIMITGDQSPTAYAIGKELNLSREDRLEILDSTHLADIDPETLKALAKRAHVFARVSPAHKLQIVQVLQEAGKVVAMTGDGINDGPALKAADVGIAMGSTGTDIAREVADVVLEEDNLDTMIIAIRDGRTTYNNIRKSVHFFLATNLSEIMLTFTALAVGLGSPLNAMQLLWINLISDIFPGLALAMEAPEPDIMRRPPRNPQRPIFTGSDFRRIAFEGAAMTGGALGVFGYGVMRYGLGAQASTLAFHGLTAGQLLHALSCRSEQYSVLSPGKLPPNRYLTAALAGSLGLQVLTAVVPGLRTILGLTPISLLDGLVVAGGAALPLLVNEVTKKPPAENEAI
ncbi:MAG: HAD-IC family P-type ATPase [Thermodesulfobacteriota bacterium]